MRWLQNDDWPLRPAVSAIGPPRSHCRRKRLQNAALPHDAAPARLDQRRDCAPQGCEIGKLAIDFLEMRRGDLIAGRAVARSVEHTSELQSLMSISYAAFCLTKKK